MIMTESLYSEFRRSSFDYRHHQRSRSPHSARRVCAASVRIFDPALQHGTSLWASPSVAVPGWMRRRAEKGHFAPLMAIRRIVTAIRLWRGHARSRQQLRALSDHLLKDIGLRREDFGSEFPKPFQHSD